MGLAARVKLFDAYHKPERHLTKKTAAGGAVTLSSLLLMAFIFVFELRSYLATERVTTTGVDVTRDEMLAINVDVTFTSLPCQTLSLDALDASGKHDQDVGGELHKTRVDRFGRAIATYESHRENDDGVVNLITELFYGFETEGHKAHVDEIKSALSAGEGCRVHGRLKVQRVAGNFHVSVHGEDARTLRATFEHPRNVNMSHVVHRLSFGKSFPRKEDPLSGFTRATRHANETGTYKYFLKVVPVTYTGKSSPSALKAYERKFRRESAALAIETKRKKKRLEKMRARGVEGGGGGGGGGGKERWVEAKTPRGVTRTNLYSVTETYIPTKNWNGGSLPAVYFIYDLSPIAVTISDARKSFGHFLARTVAGVGGAYAIAGLIDRMIHHSLTVPPGKLH